MLFENQNIDEKKVGYCPYCQGKNFVKCGKRSKKHEFIQIHFCKKCQKKFTTGVTKHKTFPLRLILDSMTLYNRLNTFEESAHQVSEKYGLNVSFQNISNWVSDFKEYLPFLRIREFVEKKYAKKDILVESKMFHGQVYDFKWMAYMK